jgi:dTDP-4-amino-4,6-dideoxygalactose transaminase
VLTKRTKAVIVVHLAGYAAEMDELLKFAKEKGLKVIEDCAQCHGAKYKDRPLGSFGDVAAFSFCQDKILTTGGEGGMIVTNDQEVWRRAWAYKDHGKNYEAIFNASQQTSRGSTFRYVHDSFGSNWRFVSKVPFLSLQRSCSSFLLFFFSICLN